MNIRQAKTILRKNKIRGRKLTKRQRALIVKLTLGRRITKRQRDKC